MLARVEREAVHYGLGRLLVRAFDQRVQAGDHLVDVERLRHVVVAARSEPAEAIRQRVARAQEQHRRSHSLRPQRLAHVAAVRVGQPDIDHQRGRSVLRGAVQQLAATGDGSDGEAGGSQVPQQRFPEWQVVLDYQQ